MLGRSPVSLLEPEIPEDDAGWFDLSGPVGFGHASSRADAIRLEGILANSGDLDLAERGGPTGYWGLAQDTALRRYQKRNGLAVDGWAAPDGETVAHMRGALGGLLGGHTVPTPDDVNAHHADIATGGAGRIALAPKFELAAIAGLPDIGKAGRASNAAQIDWLTGNRSGFDGVPAQLGRYVREQGDTGLAQARDFVDQFTSRRPGESDALLAGILRELPDPATRKRFLGADPGAPAPVGVMRTMEMRREDMIAKPGDISDLVDRRGDDDPRAKILLAAESAGASDGDGKPADPQTAQAAPPEPQFEKPPAYRADVFATQPGVWDAMRDAVKADPYLGDGQRAAMMAIFAGEGGMRPDPKSGAVGGITKDYINQARDQGNWPPELAHVKSPADLKPGDMPGMYRHYLDGGLRHAGGAAVLDKIGQPTVAAAVADTVVRDGEQGARALIHGAIEGSGGPDLSAPRTRQDGKTEPAVIGKKTLDELAKIGRDPERVGRFLEMLEKGRSDQHPKDEVRNGQFRIR